MISIKIDHKGTMMHLSHPETLNELDEYQFRSVVANCFMNQIPLSERTDDRIRLMNVLLKKSINRFIKTRWYKVVDSMVNEGIIEDILKLQAFIYNDEVFTKWIIERIGIGKKTLFGPRDRFAYMRFGEFISADMLFMSYFENESQDLLNKFIAVLYRKADVIKKGVDCRENFDTSTLDERANEISKLDDTTKQSILFNYSGIRRYLNDKYPFVFKTKEEKQSTNIQLGKKQNGWMGIRRSLAGDVLNLEKIDNVFMHDVLADLNNKISEQ